MLMHHKFRYFIFINSCICYYVDLKFLTGQMHIFHLERSKYENLFTRNVLVQIYFNYSYLNIIIQSRKKQKQNLVKQSNYVKLRVITNEKIYWLSSWNKN